MVKLLYVEGVWYYSPTVFSTYTSFPQNTPSEKVKNIWTCSHEREKYLFEFVIRNKDMN